MEGAPSVSLTASPFAAGALATGATRAGLLFAAAASPWIVIVIVVGVCSFGFAAKGAHEEFKHRGHLLYGLHHLIGFVHHVEDAVDPAHAVDHALDLIEVEVAEAA